MYYTTKIDEQVIGYFCSAKCVTELRDDECVTMHMGKGDPELCDSLLCEREAV